jgi:hypothetical protein
LQNAGSIVSLLPTTETRIAKIPEKKGALARGRGHGVGIGDMYKSCPLSAVSPQPSAKAGAPLLAAFARSGNLLWVVETPSPASLC